MSNQRRRDLEQSLPPASEYLCRYLVDHIIQTGMQISNQDVAFIGRIVSDYFMNTSHGKHTALKFLKATMAPTSALKSYYPQGQFGAENKKISPKDLVEYRGWIFKGQHSVPYESVEVDEREDATICDACGGRFPVDYCMKTLQVLKSSGTTREELWCNHCRSSSEQLRIRDTANTNTCTSCEKKACDFHPKNPANIKLLPPARRSVSNGPTITSPW